MADHSQVTLSPVQQLSPELRRIVEARHHDPFAVLGRHPEGGLTLIRVYIPGARDVFLRCQRGTH